MSFFNSLFSEVFPKRKEENSISEVLVKETIKRTKSFQNEYKNWLGADMQKGLQDHLQELRLIRNSNPTANVNYYVHRSKLSNGFYFYLKNPWTANDYNFFAQFIIDKLKSKGYVLSNTLREAKEIQGELGVIEEFYLKPGLRFRREMPYEQLYGNVHIEVKSKNDNVLMLKVLVNTYSDRNFKEALSFDSFLDLVFLTD